MPTACVLFCREKASHFKPLAPPFVVFNRLDVAFHLLFSFFFFFFFFFLHVCLFVCFLCASLFVVLVVTQLVTYALPSRSLIFSCTLPLNSEIMINKRQISPEAGESNEKKIIRDTEGYIDVLACSGSTKRVKTLSLSLPPPPL